MKTYKNPEPYKIIVPTIEGAEKELTARTIVGNDFIKLQEIAEKAQKSRNSHPINGAVEQIEYIFGESRDWLLKNVTGKILLDILQDFNREMLSPTKG